MKNTVIVAGLFIIVTFTGWSSPEQLDSESFVTDLCPVRFRVRIFVG